MAELPESFPGTSLMAAAPPPPTRTLSPSPNLSFSYGSKAHDKILIRDEHSVSKDYLKFVRLEAVSHREVKRSDIWVFLSWLGRVNNCLPHPTSWLPPTAQRLSFPQCQLVLLACRSIFLGSTCCPQCCRNRSIALLLKSSTATYSNSRLESLEKTCMCVSLCKIFATCNNPSSQFQFMMESLLYYHWVFFLPL